MHAHFGKWTLISDPSPNKVVPKVENFDPKMPKQAEAKRDGVINPQNYNFHQFLYGKFWCSQNATNQPKSWPCENLLTCARFAHKQLRSYNKNCTPKLIFTCVKILRYANIVVWMGFNESKYEITSELCEWNIHDSHTWIEKAVQLNLQLSWNIKIYT